MQDKNKKESENTSLIRELCFILAADLGYNDPRNEFELRDLKLRHGQSIVKDIRSKKQREEIFPETDEWMTNYYSDYRKKLGLSLTEHSLTLHKKTKLINSAPKLTTLDFILIKKKIYQCLVCQKIETKNRRAIHLREIHWIEKPLGCNEITNGIICGIGFETAGLKKSHKPSAHPANFTCQNCGHFNKMKSRMPEHIQRNNSCSKYYATPKIPSYNSKLTKSNFK